MNLASLIRDRLGELGLTRTGMVVAVSGGADSVALLRAVADADSTGPLVAAHLNHQLRGDESDEDERFVRDLHAGLVSAGSRDLDLAVDRMPIAEMAAAEGANLEALARRERYHWLASVAKKFGVPAVVTGHTADDQAETILHRVLRGTGLQGLRGIAVRRPLEAGIELVRPMLAATRSDVLTYLCDLGQPFREDRSNTDCRFTRNRIRHEILPLLKADVSSNTVALLRQLAEHASAVFDEIEARATALLHECERPAAGPLRILDAEMLASAPLDLAREALRSLWRREGWPRDRIRFHDWDLLVAVARGELTALDLAGGVHARRHGRMLQVGLRS